MQFFSEIIFTLFILFFSITSLTGIGYLTATILKFNKDESFFHYTFFGLAVSLSLLEIIHFFYPINLYVSFAIFILGTFLFFLLRGKYIESFQLPTSKLTCTIFVILFLFWLFKSMDSITNTDSAFYHISFIKWVNEFPLVAGLGNLIIHFANNHSWFLFVSLLGFSPMIEDSYSIAGLLILILAICLIFSNRNKIPYPNILLPIFVVSIIFNTSRLSSPSPDLAINIFIIIIFFLLIEHVYAKRGNFKRFNLYLIISLCLALISIKLSGAAFACATLIFLFLYYKKFLSKKELFLIAIFIFIIFVPHILRGYFLSGYPFFPLTLGSFFNFEWKLGPDVLPFHVKTISCWAKSQMIFDNCGNDYNFNWINKWFRNTNLEIIFYLLISIFLFTFSLFKFKSNLFERKFLYLTLIPLSSLLIWFIKAPDPRFSISLIMLFFGCSICLFFSSYNIKINYITNKNKLIAVIFLSSIVATFRFSIITWENFIRIIDNGYFKILEQKYLTINVSDNLTINIPTNSKCYNIELPCVLHLNKSLYLIENNKGYPKMYYGIRK